MKLRLLYLLPFVAIFMSGCLAGSTKSAPKPIPDGNYTGEFRLLHIHKDNTIDTVKTNINLYISPVSTATYAVTGDTATVHAGSKGTYVFNDNGTAIFTDNTYSSLAPVTKTHLTGVYTYLYDGTIFQMVAYGARDTLVLQYDLKKKN
ncbi:hypothetical protein [Mucilaginibacter xinganensis]|uniref:Lipocalin-like domain-containing protein n=1 Tax=Mucilaginibacter xinganensis TaxID=1234841 RepID=A0A223P0A7_9SPHI|nr:hypothetical protein [Mucilaginibacter xinganensis]ASU35545.1 hypothetical protein MuYL_3660 [Mucilaginibacter xinganensis]